MEKTEHKVVRETSRRRAQSGPSEEPDAKRESRKGLQNGMSSK